MQIPQFLQTFLNYLRKTMDWLGIMVNIEDIPEEKRKVVAEIDTPTLELILLQRQSKEEIPTDIKFNRTLIIYTFLVLISIFVPYIIGSVAFLIIFLLTVVSALLGFGYNIIPYYYGKKDKINKNVLIFSLYYILLFAIVWIEIDSFIPQLDDKVQTFTYIILVSGIFSMFGYGISSFITQYTIGMNIINAGNFSISALSNKDINKTNKHIIINMVSNALSTKNNIFQSIFLNVFNSEDKKGKIYRVGRMGRLLVYFKKTTISFCVFNQNGKYLLQDDNTREFQDKIGFILKNNLNFINISNRDSINEDKINSMLRKYVQPSGQFLKGYKQSIIQIIIFTILIGSIIGITKLFPNSTYSNVFLGAIGAAISLALYGMVKKYFE